MITWILFVWSYNLIMSEGDSMRLNLSCKKKIPPDQNTATCFLGKFNECLFVDVTNSNLSFWLKKVYTRIRRLIAIVWSIYSETKKSYYSFSKCQVEVLCEPNRPNQLFWPRWEMSEKMNFSLMFDWPYCPLIYISLTIYIWPLQHLSI